MRLFDARETERLKELDGVELADFGQRAAAFAIDCILALATLLGVMAAVGFAIWLYRWVFSGATATVRINFEGEEGKLALETVAPLLYFGLATWLGNGQTVGKRLLGIRVVSVTHGHMDLWHSVERALGYGAAALEFGFGFVQFFIHPNRRTVQDRIAETIVVKEKSLRQRQIVAQRRVTVSTSLPPAEHAHT